MASKSQSKTSENESTFVPALIVVDMQEDFCPPVCTT